MKMTISLPAGGPRLSELVIGPGALDELPRDLSTRLGRRRAYWIWDATVRNLWGERLPALGGGVREHPEPIVFAGSEANKRLSSVEELARKLVEAGADRDSVLVAVGGGVTGDVVGFLASIYMRGIPVFQVPTTLLAQVDSSVGGKTGVDLPEGKNLLGSFHQPAVVWMDPRFLETLPAVELRQGMAEVIKTAMIGDAQLWEYLEEHHESILRRNPEAVSLIVTACCTFKAKVVEADEKEGGYRRILNFGHTIGHALERLSDYRMHHGDAVSVGMAAAAELSRRMGRLPAEAASRLEKLCRAWDLPVRVPPGSEPDAIVAALRSDKKRVGDVLHFILPVRIGEAIDCEDIDEQLLKRTLTDLLE
jgi:3-dehydroquinate synthase